MPNPYDFYNIEPELIGFYITAYGIAVKHGFSGTEQEWIASLKGEQGTATEMRYNSDLDQLEWKLVTDSEWTGVLPLAVIRGTAFDEAVASIQASTADARQSKEAAAQSATEARSQAERANTERLGAEAAKNVAESAKAGAEEAKNLTAQLKADTNEIRLQTEELKNQAEDYNRSALTAKDSAEWFSEKAGQKSLNASLAEQNAREHMQSAWEGQTLSQSWAVGGTGQREGEDSNNAKYWSDRAKDAAGGGVTSFNGRTGAIVPQASDYSGFFPQPIQLANNLTTTTTGKGLDAAQGKILKGLIDQVGEIASQAFTSAGNGKNAIANAITGKGVEASNIDTFPELAIKIGQIRQGSGNAQPTDVLQGKTFSNDQGDQVGTMQNHGNWGAEMDASGTTVIPRGYHDGNGRVTVRTLGGRIITPRTTQQVAIASRYMARGNIYVAGDSDLVAGNIRQGVNIFGVQGTAKTDYSAEQAMIANALTGMGVPTSTTASWQTMAENINSLGDRAYDFLYAKDIESSDCFIAEGYGDTLDVRGVEFHKEFISYLSPNFSIRGTINRYAHGRSSEYSMFGFIKKKIKIKNGIKSIHVIGQVLSRDSNGFSGAFSSITLFTNWDSRIKANSRIPLNMDFGHTVYLKQNPEYNGDRFYTQYNNALIPPGEYYIRFYIGETTGGTPKFIALMPF